MVWEGSSKTEDGRGSDGIGMKKERDMERVEMKKIWVNEKGEEMERKG